MSEISEVSQILKAVQHPIRRKILVILESKKNGLSYSDLLPICDGATGKLNYHLRALEGLLINPNNCYKITAKGRLVLHWLAKIEESEMKGNDHPVVSFLKILPDESQLSKMYVWFIVSFPLFALLGTIIISLYMLLIYYIGTKLVLNFDNLIEYKTYNLETIITIYCIGILTVFFLGIIFIKPYFKSIWYQITDTEIIVHKGIITSTVKIVPFRTITNIEIKRGLIERKFNLSSLHISTAGKNKPEEVLVGFIEPYEIRETILTTVRMLNPPGTDTNEKKQLYVFAEIISQINKNTDKLEQIFN